MHCTLLPSSPVHVQPFTYQNVSSFTDHTQRTSCYQWPTTIHSSLNLLSWQHLMANFQTCIWVNPNFAGERAANFSRWWLQFLAICCGSTFYAVHVVTICVDGWPVYVCYSCKCCFKWTKMKNCKEIDGVLKRGTKSGNLSCWLSMNIRLPLCNQWNMLQKVADLSELLGHLLNDGWWW